MAAESGEHLRPNATSTELLDAYITRRCPSDAARAGLRLLAVEMNRQLRGSLTALEVRGLLHRGGTDKLVVGLDAVLSSPLRTLTQGRVAFTHELFARFLTAKQLVLDADDSTTLAEALHEPHHADLKAHPVAIEHDATRRRDLLLALADTRLLLAAVHGEFGPDTATAIRSEVGAVLAEATLATADAQFTRQEGDPDLVFDGHWHVSAPRTDTEQGLLQVAGRCLAGGLFLEQVCALLDATDRRRADEMRALRDCGHRAAISAIISSTYGGFFYTDKRERVKLPASVILNTCEFSRLDCRPALERSAAHAMWEGTTLTPPRWGRLTLALELLNRDDPSDLALLPVVFAAAWKANGYNLRLTALMTAGQLARWVDDVTRERMRAALDACDTDNRWLNSSLFETLAAYGGVDPLNTEEGIREGIDKILAEYDNPNAEEPSPADWSAWCSRTRRSTARSTRSWRLDPVKYLCLHVMAARSTEIPVNRDWMMNAIVERIEHADAAAREVLRDGVLSIDWRGPFREETSAPT